MEIEKNPEDDVLIYSLAGDFDSQEAKTFCDSVTSDITAGHAKLLLDLERLSFLDSTAIKCLLQNSEKLAQAGGGLAMVKPKAMVKKVMKILELERQIPTFDEVGPALEYLRSGG